VITAAPQVEGSKRTISIKRKICQESSINGFVRGRRRPPWRIPSSF
jgi:hypothetical protein